ncbi:TraR/DksA family transcriptional regulator [Massilia cavernae]|uniref:TraR/DksA family transcriptional regulator n=1 Tax=Massilia cavernae TaxID=2320864 RepID=UPI0015FFC7AF|nr:TraR/DksA family transcriptional regulator [Massilia cavernae]
MTYLNGDQIKALEAILQNRRSKLLQEMRAYLYREGDHGQRRLAEASGAGDGAAATILAEMDIGFLQHETAELRAIDAALARMATASYGTCASCGNDISLARMRAQPTAHMCLACQQHVERHRTCDSARAGSKME